MLCARIDPATSTVAELADWPTDNVASVVTGHPWVKAEPAGQRVTPEIGWGYEPGHPAWWAPIWVQPVTSDQAYPLDFWVFHVPTMRLARSMVDKNVWEPGRANWRYAALDGNDAYLLPTGAQDAHKMGDVLVWESTSPDGRTPPGDDHRHESLVDNNTWPPDTNPGTLWRDLDAAEHEDDTEWRTGLDVIPGDFLHYEGFWYKCLQPHETIAGWEPPNVPALWEATGRPVEESPIEVKGRRRRKR